ncbi:hypothetical protein XOC_0751 [Xanthomonas oryzae pv. oryzicola BLS256]|uniref:Uncharacterized protein n=1 Tax=Xanthomonas oryzae pv. oryzicola (strain BLS256) TaxID=383407 RepID=G7TCH1_XANOB|nr:hypothetical protein XOC_0751 [Xanthomonas oryzae pv. oryzicola BLS256]QEO99183.1 hypothetical protein XOCgx_4196 [Xanthomonas oryzae pv. oryzicola]
MTDPGAGNPTTRAQVTGPGRPEPSAICCLQAPHTAPRGCRCRVPPRTDTACHC